MDEWVWSTGGMILTKNSRREICSHTTWPNKISTWTALGSSPGLRWEVSANNCLSRWSRSELMRTGRNVYSGIILYWISYWNGSNYHSTLLYTGDTSVPIIRLQLLELSQQKQIICIWKTCTEYDTREQIIYITVRVLLAEKIWWNLRWLKSDVRHPSHMRVQLRMGYQNLSKCWTYSCGIFGKK